MSTRNHQFDNALLSNERRRTDFPSWHRTIIKEAREEVITSGEKVSRPPA